MGVVAGLRLLGRQRAWRWWTVASFLARLPVTMTLLALVLLGEQVTGSIAVGAQLTGVAILASGLSALWRGRMLDGGELTAGLRRDCLLTAAAVGGLATAAFTAASLPVLFALAALQGVAMAALSGGFRALLPVIVAREDLPRANAVEAVFAEVAFVTGPALAGLLAMAFGALSVQVLMAAAVSTAGVVVSFLPRLEPPTQRPAFAPWKVEGVKPLFAIAMAVGVALGMFESLVPARLVSMGADSALAGPLLAMFAAGSVITGLIATSRAERVTHPARPAVWLLLSLGLLMSPVALAPSLMLLGAILLFAGGPIAPLNALGTIRLQSVVPPGRQAEGFSLYIASVMIGAGLGQSVTGLLLPVLGAERLIVLCALVPLVAAGVVSFVRGSRAHVIAQGVAEDRA